MESPWLVWTVLPEKSVMFANPRPACNRPGLDTVRGPLGCVSDWLSCPPSSCCITACEKHHYLYFLDWWAPSPHHCPHPQTAPALGCGPELGPDPLVSVWSSIRSSFFLSFSSLYKITYSWIFNVDFLEDFFFQSSNSKVIKITILLCVGVIFLQMTVQMRNV